MTLRDMTFSDVDRLGVDGEAIAGTMSMDEEAFRGFYERTARILWAYLSRATGEPQVADDLLQEAYYRLLRARVEFTDETHRRHYLFRIATNLVRDRRRRPMRELPLPDLDDDRLHPTDDGLDAAVVARRDVGRALDALRPRDRDLLWLAYALGLSHQEIAANLNVRPGSVRMLLFRARARLVQLLSPARDVVAGEK